MRKWQTNLIVEAIQAIELDPRQFELGNDDGDSPFRIKHKWSLSCFTIRSEGAYSVASYVVGDGPEWPLGALGWQTIIARISSWLDDVKRDLETPDLWADLQREAKLLGAMPWDVTENTPFTSDEQNEIATQLQAWAEQAQRTYSLTAAQMQAVDAKLNYLVNAARRLDRKDWLNACVGAILGYILIASLPPEAARGMFLGLLRAVGRLYGMPDLPMLL